MKVKQNMTTDQGTRRRQIRLHPALDDELERIARRRGSSVSALFREAAMSHFSLFESVSQTIEAKENENKNG